MKERLLEEIRKVGDLVASDLAGVENIRIAYLGKKGLLNDLFAEFKTVPGGSPKGRT